MVVELVREFYTGLLSARKEAKEGRSAVKRKIAGLTDTQLVNLAREAAKEFAKRPRLKNIVLVSYLRPGHWSLGKGCQTLVLNRDGSVFFEKKQGAWGCIWEL